MKSGELDRRITLQRQGAEIDNGLGTEPGAWADLATVWAKLMPMSGAERLAALQNTAFANARFAIRRSTEVADVSAKDRISYAGDVYDIANVREDGRTLFVIDAVARDDG